MVKEEGIQSLWEAIKGKAEGQVSCCGPVSLTGTAVTRLVGAVRVIFVITRETHLTAVPYN